MEIVKRKKNGVHLRNCNEKGNEMKNSIEKIKWGKFEGADVSLWKLVNANGVELDITDFGGRLVNALVPDRFGNWDNITLGWETLDEYVGEHGGT